MKTQSWFLTARTHYFGVDYDAKHTVQNTKCINSSLQPLPRAVRDENGSLLVSPLDPCPRQSKWNLLTLPRYVEASGDHRGREEGGLFLGGVRRE